MKPIDLGNALALAGAVIASVVAATNTGARTQVRVEQVAPRVVPIVETTLPGMDKEPSQGSHFFHNLTSFQVCYFSLHHAGAYRVDWDWLRDQKEIERKEFVRHVRLSRPLTVKVDGRTGRGVVSL